MSRLLLAIVLALSTMVVALLLPAEVARLSLGMTLAVIGGIYLGFAYLEDKLSNITIEGIHFVLFFVVALAGVTLSWWFLVAGYFAHGLWDFAHHPHGITTKIPRWYVPACVVYDWLVGAFLVAYVLA